MSQLIVLAFDDKEEAAKVRDVIGQAQHGGFISLDDSAVVVKDDNGKIHVRNEVDSGVKVGAGIGGLLGLLIGFMFAGPLASVLIGAVTGAALGSLAELGVDQKFVKDVTEQMDNGSSALFMIFRNADPDVALSALKPYQGRVLHTTLSTEAESNLRNVLKSRM